MAEVVLLDSGPLGMVSHPRPRGDIIEWLTTLVAAGVYPVKVTAYDAANTVIFSATRMVRVYPRGEFAIRAVDVYKNFVARMAAGYVPSLLRCFTGDMQGIYSTVINDLAVPLSDVASGLGLFVDGMVGEDTAEITLGRDGPHGMQLFFVHLIRGKDGVWRIESL